MPKEKEEKKYNIFKPWLTLDPWQKDYINSKGNCFLICGRQSGKTTAASIKFGDRAALNPNRIILMIAETEKQAYNLFFKTLMYLEAKHPQKIKRGKDKPTKHQINMKNGSILMCYAAGLDGSGLRTYTLTDLVIDEAAPMAREIFVATMPMLSVTGGTMDIMSTPRGKQGFFFDCSNDKRFKKFYVSAEDCPRHDQDFLDAQKEQMSKLEYAQEYLALFLDDLRRVYSDKLIKAHFILKRRLEIIPNRRYYLGSDIAGLGVDESTYEVFDKIDNEHVEQVESITSQGNLTTENTLNILALEYHYHLKKLGIDNAAGGGGFGVYCELLDDDLTKRKTVGLDNASKDLDYKGEKKNNLLKVDMHLQTLSELEHGRLKLLDDDEMIASFKSVQYENVSKPGQKTVMRIFGNNTHHAEGVVRGVWLAVKDKSLNIFMRSF